MMQEIVLIISVIFAVNAFQQSLYIPGYTKCGTFNQTGLCPLMKVGYRAYVNDTLRLLLEHKSWILAAASSNAKDAPPPSDTCVTITVTDTKKHSECIFNSYNHTPHMARRVQIMGYDEDDKMQVYSVGAIHNWPLHDFHLGSRDEYREYLFSKNYLHMNSMIKSTTCWNPVTMKFDPYRFIITNPFYNMIVYNIPHKAQYLLLIGVNARAPTPELHIALLADRLSDVRDVRACLSNLEGARRTPYFFMTEYPDYMPNMTVRCAIGYNKP